MTGPRLIRCVAAVLSVALLASCSDDVAGEDVMPLARGESLDEMRQQAGGILARYDAAVAEAGPSASPSVEVPLLDAGSAPGGKAIEAARGTEASTRLTVTFIGAKGPATESCGADYYAEAVESDRAVVVVVIAQEHAAGEVCTLVGYERTAKLNLAEPLGKRAVLEARQGLTVPLTPALGTD